MIDAQIVFKVSQPNLTSYRKHSFRSNINPAVNRFTPVEEVDFATV